MHSSGIKATTKLVYIDGITSRDSNHLPHDSHCDVLPTTLRMGSSGKMIYEGFGDHRGQHCTRSSFFPAYGSTNPDVF